MKTVYTDISTIAHLWANQLQQEAKNPHRNFYFWGKSIYSYGSHFEIARHVNNFSGDKAILFTERTYSSTTAGHIGVARQAARHLNLIYCYSPEENHEGNFAFWYNNANHIGEKLISARKPEIYLSQIDTIKTKVIAYSEFFGLEIPLDLQTVLNVGNKAEFILFKDKKEELEKIQEQKRVADLKIQHSKELKKWNSFKVIRLSVHDGNDYLRLNQEDKRVETTQAVQIPLEIAIKFFNHIKSGDCKVGDTILSYTVNHIDAKEIKIGCHTFKLSYLDKFAKKNF